MKSKLRRRSAGVGIGRKAGKRHLFAIGCVALGMTSCGENEDPVPPKVVDVPKPVRESTILAQETFAYPDGELIGNPVIAGFTRGWTKMHGGKAMVLDGILSIEAPVRLSYTLDTSVEGPFSRYIDSEGSLGKDGEVIYISFYQELAQIDLRNVQIFEVMNGPGDIIDTTRFNVGNDTMPFPMGPFGLRVKRSSSLVIPAPEDINRRENLIVLRVQFGEGDNDTISYYYNPLPEDEGNPVDIILNNDLSFDRIGLACFEEGGVKLRSLIFCENFQDAARER